LSAHAHWKLSIQFLCQFFPGSALYEKIKRIEPISKIGFWFKIAAGPSLKLQAYCCMLRILNEAPIPPKGGRPKDIFEMGSKHFGRIGERIKWNQPVVVKILTA
jgi:hypothetical protein